MGVLEWIGAHLLAPFVSLYRAVLLRPRPDPRILTVNFGGGGADSLDFNVELANYGTQQCRADLTAQVGDRPVLCNPSALDLIPNSLPKGARIILPRPQLVDLMPECDGVPTLYDETLYVRLSTGRHHDEKTWHEVIYGRETDHEHFEAQRRYWRRGRGEETENDRREDAVSETEKRMDSA
jgi:hypothetical protein